MPKKQFEEVPYDPIVADLVREVAQGNRSKVVPLPALEAAAAPNASPPVSAHVVSRAGASAGSPATLTVSVERGPQLAAAEPTITKRFLLTRSENEELESFLLRMQKAAGVKVTLSTFVRALLNVAMQAEGHLAAEVSVGGPCRFPSTHDPIAQGGFEEWWMRCLSNALRRMPKGGTGLR